MYDSKRMHVPHSNDNLLDYASSLFLLQVSILLYMFEQVFSRAKFSDYVQVSLCLKTTFKLD